MRNKIYRTAFWFQDGDDQLISLNERYFGLSTLLNRLLNEVYQGKKIKFINIFFNTEKTYELHPQAFKNQLHFSGGHLNYNDVFDLSGFYDLKDFQQNNIIWEKATQILQISAKSIKNGDLLKAIDYAYEKGIETNLNPDYRMVESDILIYGEVVKASVWVNFRKDGMYSKLTLEKSGQVLFEKNIDKARNGIEFFLEMYKSISAEGNTVIIKGPKDVDYLPLYVTIESKLT